MFSKILVAYDGSAMAKKALETASGFAKENPSLQVDVLFVSNLPYVVVADGVVMPSASRTMEYLDYAQSIVDEAKQLTAAIQNVNIVQKDGVIARTILEYAEENRCDLIIIGSRGHSALGEIVLGSVSHNVVQHSRIPVLIVK